MKLSITFAEKVYLPSEEMRQRNETLELPPSVSCNRYVREEPRYDTFWFFPDIAESERILTNFLRPIFYKLTTLLLQILQGQRGKC